MATVNFYLKKTDKKGEAAIMLTYLHKGKKFRYYTRLKTKPNTWKDQRVKSNFIGFQEINGLLDDLENSLKTIEREALFNKKDYSIELIKKKFLQKLGELRNENNFFTVYDRFIEESRPIKAKNTIKAYAETKRKIQQFASAKSFKITFENIDQNFYEAFLNYLIKDLGHLNNTVGKHIKTLKTFLNYSIDHEYTNMNYNLKKFKVLSEEVDIIYLTEEELMKIYEQKGLSKKLSNVRDNFCFACFTGLRFSDISKIKYSHINNDFIEIRTNKTKDSLRIPLNNYAIEIINKYKGQSFFSPLPTVFSNDKSNEYLKEIGRISGFNETISMEKFSGSNKIIINKPKYELLSTHTARRTFVTLALEKGIRAEVVMAMTGHKNYKTFKKYIKITDKVMQNEMNRVWNIPTLKAV